MSDVDWVNCFYSIIVKEGFSTLLSYIFEYFVEFGGSGVFCVLFVLFLISVDEWDVSYMSWSLFGSFVCCCVRFECSWLCCFFVFLFRCCVVV